MTDLWRGRELHFIGIGGAGMSGLALVCAGLGARVTGSDRADSAYLERLREAGIAPLIGHDADSVPPGAEVIVSTAVPAENPELARASERGQTVTHRGALLARVCAEKRLIAVAGTHGKTTTAGMVTHALRAIGAEPAFLLGGELPGAGPDGDAANAGWAEGGWVVAEADESDGSFLELRPEVAVITNLELDHHSHWSSLASLEEAFAGFAESARVVALWDDPSLDALTRRIEEAGPECLRFGNSEPDGDRAHASKDAQDLSPKTSSAELELAVPGRHNVLNALAALAAIELAGHDVALAQAALASFPGMRRRLELKGEVGGARVYDDYAHHPTEVSATLQAARELGGGRLIAIFQPHLYSRTKAMAGEFGRALAAADEIGVLDVYPAREQPVGELAGVSGLAVARAAADAAGGRPVWWLAEMDPAYEAIAPRLRDGDVVVTMGAGDIDRLAERLVAAPTTVPA